MSVLEEKAQCALMEAAKRLKPERLAEPISPAEHRNLLKEGSGAETEKSRPEKHKETGERCGVRRVSEANLKHECFGRKSTVCFDGGRECG